MAKQRLLGGWLCTLEATMDCAVSNDKPAASVHVQLDRDLLDRLEAFRKSQATIPSRAACLRKFLAVGLENASADQHATA
jgi:hypothetical protein